jgi:predicted anti-sigma-YlaC factor YlaD
VATCETYREALSARIDGEQEPVPAEETDQHLDGCAACQDWQARAIEVTRNLRVQEVKAVPDLTARILETAPVPVSTRGWWPRLALGVVAVAQLTLGLTQVLGVPSPHGTGGLSGHLFNESAAWNLALGIGLFWVVFRTSAAAGLIPVLSCFVLVLVGFSTHDLITGAAPVSRVAGHGLLLAGLALLVIVHRQHRDPAPGHDDALTEPHTAASGQPAAPLASPERHDRGQDGTGLRPVGRHVA